MRWRVHPLFFIVFLACFFTGHMALYSILFISLIWHEMGHILVAKIVGVRIVQCMLAPYGGEIQFEKQYTISIEKKCWITLGGPCASLIGVIISAMSPSLIGETFFQMHLFIFLLNIVPLYPLDGGRIVLYILLLFLPKYKIYERFLSLSYGFITIILIVMLFYLPHSLSLVLISLFLWVNLRNEWVSRKYNAAFEKIVLKRLT